MRRLGQVPKSRVLFLLLKRFTIWTELARDRARKGDKHRNKSEGILVRSILLAMAALWMANPGAALAQSLDAKLNLHGLIVGDKFDAQKMKSAGLSCVSASKAQQSPPTVLVCLGKVSLVGEEFSGFVDIDQVKGKRLVAMIMLQHAMNDFDGHYAGISFEGMEQKLVTFFGPPDVLRTESPLQPVQYPDNELAYTRRGGSDTWYVGGNTVRYEQMLQDVSPDIPHTAIYAATVTYSMEKRSASFNMPINHPFVVMLATASIGSQVSWVDGDNLIMRGRNNPQMYGMKCVIQRKPPEPGSTGNYAAALRCADGFPSIAVPTADSGDRTQVFLFKGNQLVASGYVIARKADP